MRDVVGVVGQRLHPDAENDVQHVTACVPGGEERVALFAADPTPVLDDGTGEGVHRLQRRIVHGFAGPQGGRWS